MVTLPLLAAIFTEEDSMGFYLYVNDQTAGPYEKEQLSQMLAAGQVAAGTPCCVEGAAEWQTVEVCVDGGEAPMAATPPVMPAAGAGVFGHTTYLVRRKLFSLFGAGFHIYDSTGQVVFFSELKAFKLKEDVRIFTGEDKKTEVLTIKARKILDFSSAYDVFDPATQERVGALKRKGLKSLIRDEWVFMNAADQDIGFIREESQALAILRRLWEVFALVLPQKYDGDIGGTKVCLFSQHFNPFIMKVTLDFSQDTQGLLDRRLGIAAAILLCAIEGKQT